MSTFVLVHGAWRGQWCWSRVASALRVLGHEVYSPSLTGLADRSHLASPEVDLETHILDIVNLVKWEDLSDVVLCGHSYAGFVITGVADRIPERLNTLVYLDAFVPEHGMSMLDATSPVRRAAHLSRVDHERGGWMVKPPAVQARTHDPDYHRRVMSLSTPHPLRCIEQKLSLSGEIDGRIRRVFVEATEFASSPFRTLASELRQQDDWQVHAVASDHDVMLDEPDELVRILLAAANVR
ncbi:alpha/beta fold hydrolase [Caballeronia sp. dw_19]|uniref:alpha/beta fold hydrolase n=1 Tax=Caballeronia sp. dw_19 TaxID=2719791 RepID=UPI001BD3B38D|nr:alpha/beta fold hydrolase [Caballeronia sp. dw_19]